MHLRHHRLLRPPPILQIRCQSSYKPIPGSENEDITTLRSALRRTVPEHHSLLLLHTKTPPDQWPTDVSKVSPLMRDILPHVKGFQGKVLMYYPGNDFLKFSSTSLMTRGQSKDYRHYTATYFTKLHPPFEIPILSPELLPQFLDLFKSRMQTGVNVASVLDPPQSQGIWPNGGLHRNANGTDEMSEKGASNLNGNFQARSFHRSSLKSQEIDRGRVKQTWILVCAHGARDCRCGWRGPVVADKIREYIKEKGLERSVVVGEVSHVGGHRYAPNVLVYPDGDWYGTLQPPEVESFMDSLLGVEDDDSLSGPRSPLWRGSWFDHPGIPSVLEQGPATNTGMEGEAVESIGSASTGGIDIIEKERLQSRMELELMRVERDASLRFRGTAGSKGEALEESWGTDLDSLARGD